MRISFKLSATILGVTALLLLMGCNDPVNNDDNGDGDAATTYTDLSAATVKAELASFDAIFDVSPYYSNGHLPGATDAYQKLAMLIASMDKEGKYLVYCHGDGPSMAGAQQMEDAGFTNVFRLEGNYGAWTGAGYPVE